MLRNPTRVVSSILRSGLCAVTALASLSGCNLNEFSVNLTAPVLKEASKSLAEESDVQLARDSAPGSIETVLGFLWSSPHNRDLLEVCSQGLIEYAFGFIEDDYESMADGPAKDAVAARATGLYDRALGLALRLIATRDSSFGGEFKKNASATEAAAAKLDKKSVAGLMYAGLALASSINLNRNDVSRVVDLPKATALIKRAYELDPGFHNASAAMSLGLIYSSQGKAMGGNPDLAKKYFDEAAQRTGGKFLFVPVFMARFYAVITQDRPLFESTLKRVLETPADIDPSQRLANELAKRRAKRFLDHVEDYF